MTLRKNDSIFQNTGSPRLLWFQLLRSLIQYGLQTVLGFAMVQFPGPWLRKNLTIRGLNSVQDFLIMLDSKPLMHLVEISTFLLNNVIVRLTKIMNRADKN